MCRLSGEDAVVISLKESQKFFSQDEVWGTDVDTGVLVCGEPIRFNRLQGICRIKVDDVIHKCKGFSLQEPRQREFEDGAWYPVFKDDMKAQLIMIYSKEDSGFYGNQIWYLPEDLNIGEKLPPELWDECK